MNVRMNLNRSMSFVDFLAQKFTGISTTAGPFQKLQHGKLRPITFGSAQRKLHLSYTADTVVVHWVLVPILESIHVDSLTGRDPGLLEMECYHNCIVNTVNQVSRPWTT